MNAIFNKKYKGNLNSIKAVVNSSKSNFSTEFQKYVVLLSRKKAFRKQLLNKLVLTTNDIKYLSLEEMTEKQISYEFYLICS